jgi:acyl-CoA dehydrogenase
MTEVRTGELAELREQVRELTGRWREAGRFTPRPDAWLRGFDRDFSKALAAEGWIGITWPRDLGGAERSNLARLAITEELLRAGAPVAAHWIADRQIGPAILRYGTRRLQEEFLPQIAAGDLCICLGMSETEAGSDLAAVRTTATRIDGGWSITGSKIWTSQAHRSEYAYVLARTDSSGDKHQGLSEFLLAMDADGVSVEPIVDLQGEHHFNEVRFDDVRIPEHWVIGEVGNGWSQVTDQLAFERGGAERVLSTYPVLEAAIDHLRDSDDTGAIEQLGRLAARVTALRRKVWEVALALDRGEAPVVEAAMTKYLGTAFETEVAHVARELFDVAPRPPSGSPAGLVGDALLAAPGFSIRGGSSGVLLGIIGRAQTR